MNEKIIFWMLLIGYLVMAIYTIETITRLNNRIDVIQQVRDDNKKSLDKFKSEQMVLNKYIHTHRRP